ncbi:MAG TPA: DUF2461 domain-containing protein [Cryomorphaceae bacterium]|nr:DUF2461 domain-containing protein [Cryomorphaceae bacterium]
MSFYQVFDFLRDLNQNNHKEWMDDHRKRYEENRDFVVEWANDLMAKIAKADPDFKPVTGKKAISRINNNLLYHPDKPVYKDHFGVEMNLSGGPSGFYIQLGLSHNFIGGGIWSPSKDQLEKIRGAIDYNGEELKKIIEKKSFKYTFDGLSEQDKLKTAPRDYSQDHKHIELLRLKRFATMVGITQKEITSDDFEKKVVKYYKEMMPLGRYLNKAVSI